ncbi:hypothetical protein PENTCL1PPCAC_4001, partial [Pristionchus entomophagus]
RFTAEMKAFSTQELAGMRDMDEIFPLLDQLQDRRIIIHIFSMDGAYSLTALLHHKKYSGLFRWSHLGQVRYPILINCS